MTPAQWTVLRAMALPTGENRASVIHPRTIAALLALRLIEECPRMYFGPREPRYRLTALGREAIAASNKRSTGRRTMPSNSHSKGDEK